MKFFHLGKAKSCQLRQLYFSMLIIIAAFARVAYKLSESMLLLAWTEISSPSVLFLFQLARADRIATLKHGYFPLLLYKRFWKSNNRFRDIYLRHISALDYTANPQNLAIPRPPVSASNDFFFGYFHQNFGHLSLIDVYAKAKILGLDAKRYTFIRHPRGTANNYYLDLICNSYGIACVETDFHSYSFLNSQYLKSGQLCDPYGFNFSAVGQVGLYEGWNIVLDQWAQGGFKSIISFPDELVAKSLLILSENGIDISAPFVTIHTRYSPRSSADRSGADVSIINYEPAIRFLVKAGYTVVRIGQSEPVYIDIEGYYDIGSLGLPGFVDIYLLSNAAFMIGCGSGPLSVPPTFDVPVLYVNAPCMGHIPRFARSRFIPQNIFSAAHNRVLTYQETLRTPLAFSTLPSSSSLHRLSSTKDEILAAVMEFQHMVELNDFKASPIHVLQIAQLSSCIRSDSAGMLISRSFCDLNPNYLS
jgi:putative glycosyltransferase (TIGR04372 family)